jgi:fucose permease
VQRGPSAGTLPLFSGFLLAGVLTVLLGPLVSELLARRVVTEAQAALLFPAQFACSSIGSVLSSQRLLRSLRVGYLACAAGLAIGASLRWPALPCGVALLGLGLGLVIPATNLLVAERYPVRRASALSGLNLLWSIGAVGCPLLFAALPYGLSLRALLAALAIAAAGSGLAVIATLGEAARSGPDGSSGPEDPPVPGSRLVVLGAMLFLYVGSESAVGGWLVTVSDRVGGDQSLASLAIGSGFWAALLVGRAVTPLALRRWSEDRLFRVALAIAGLGTMLLLFAASRPVLAAGAVAVGLGLSPLFPLTVSRIAGETARGSRRAGWVFVGSGLGGACLPWLTSRVGALLAELQRGLSVPLLALVALGLLAQLRAPAGRPRAAA